MAKADEDSGKIPNTEKTAQGIEDAVRLATHAFGGLNVSDQELDNLCDVALSERVPLRTARTEKTASIVDRALTSPTSEERP